MKRWVVYSVYCCMVVMMCVPLVCAAVSDAHVHGAESQAAHDGAGECPHTPLPSLAVTTSPSLPPPQTGRLIPPLTENQRMAKVFLGEGNFKVSIPTLNCCSCNLTLRHIRTKGICTQCYQ